MRDFKGVLSRIGVDISPAAKILDFGCGAGGTVRFLRDQGYDAYGYDVDDELSRRDPAEQASFIVIGTRLDIRLPFPDNSFDLVLSDQVFEHVQDQGAAWRELHRVMKPGGHALHVIPARYMPLEGHMFVPFGAVLTYRWWFLLWAALGVRNQYQRGMGVSEIADRNLAFHFDGLRYVPTSQYKVAWTKIGFRYDFVTRQYLASHRRSFARLIAGVSRMFPPILFLYRLLQSRHVYLQKIND
jgi:SAM-dependent methyltransferase